MVDGDRAQQLGHGNDDPFSVSQLGRDACVYMSMERSRTRSVRWREMEPTVATSMRLWNRGMQHGRWLLFHKGQILLQSNDVLKKDKHDYTAID